MNLTGILLLAVVAVAGTSPKVTAQWSCADSKEGYTYFSGKVRMADDACDIHADRAYVFMDGTNEMRRVVAFGNVAVTNGARSAYGDTVSYFRDAGMVVVSSGASRTTEVRDESKTPPSEIRGRRVRFWTQTDQVEVLESDVAVPRQESGQGGFKGTFGY